MEKLKREHEALLLRVKQPLKEITRLETENNQLKQKLAETENSLLDLSQSYDGLKKTSAAFSRLKADHQTTTAQLTKMRKQNDRLTETLSQLQRQQIFRWFLSGAGVLLVGIIIGVSTKSRRRRSSLL
jgi:SH3 domain protein